MGAGQGPITAIVVPWEGTATTMSMAVTSVRADGWAIEHTNLGTNPADRSGQRHDGCRAHGRRARPGRQGRLLALFDRFARQLQGQFEAAS